MSTEEQKARVRAIRAKAQAEGREVTLDDLIPCIGEDVTDRLTFGRRGDGTEVAYLDGKEYGEVKEP